MPKAANEERLLDQLAAALKFDRDDLDSALIEQPDIFYRVASNCALAISRRDEAKLDRDNGMAKLAQQLRESWEEKDGKLTEKALSEMVDQAPKTDTLRRDYLRACLNADEWQALKEAFQDRSRALKGMVDLYIAGYFTTATGRAARNDAGERRSGEIREQAGKERRVRSMKED